MRISVFAIYILSLLFKKVKFQLYAINFEFHFNKFSFQLLNKGYK